MKRTWLIALVAVVIGIPAALDAQQPAPRPRATARARPRGFSYNFSTENRGRIGVVVNTAANADSDQIGARIVAVTPSGPADKAGLKAGDVITKFNGTALGGVQAGDNDDEQSGPGMKLVELARAVILTVGGRKATTPEHAMRILHSYDTGESVSIEVMRHQRKLTLNWTVPSEERHMTPGRRRPGARGEPSVFRWKTTPAQWKV